MSDQLRRSLDVECRILNEKEGLVEYVASDATLDSYDESILVSGWKFTYFAKNAPFVDSHNYWCIENLLGAVESARFEGGKLIERVRWAKDIAENKLAVLGWKMTAAGFLKAVSVGFRSLKSVRPGDSGWNGAVQQAGLSPEHAQRCRRIFIEQEQLELSACILGANPEAVAKAFNQGGISEADLASVGFTDDDMSFVALAGRLFDSGTADETTKLRIAHQMGRISARSTTLRNPKTPTNSPSSDKPGGDETARRQAEADAAFLRELDALIKK